MKKKCQYEPIAKFYVSYYPGNEEFGYSIFVYSMQNDYVKVESEGRLQDFYVSFEEFFEDLCQKNPLWFTYNMIEIPEKYKNLISTKLSLAYELVFKWVLTSILSAQTWTSKPKDTSVLQHDSAFLSSGWIRNQIREGLKKSGLPADWLKTI